jgi:predicted O-methyltransferase YrrM
MTDLADLHAEKWFWANFFERFAALHDDEQMMAVYRKFGPEVFRRSSVLEGLDAFVKANGFTGKRCVEIGTCNGLTAIVLARYFEHVCTVDIVARPMAQQVASLLGVHNITWYTVDNNADKADLIKNDFHEGRSFDAAFVDGDHAADTETDFALVARCGRVLFHEHWAPQPPVLNLVRRLAARGDKVVTAGKWALWDGGG